MIERIPSEGPDFNNLGSNINNYLSFLEACDQIGLNDSPKDVAVYLQEWKNAVLSQQPTGFDKKLALAVENFALRQRLTYGLRQNPCTLRLILENTTEGLIPAKAPIDIRFLDPIGVTCFLKDSLYRSLFDGAYKSSVAMQITNSPFIFIKYNSSIENNAIENCYLHEKSHLFLSSCGLIPQFEGYPSYTFHIMARNLGFDTVQQSLQRVRPFLSRPIMDSLWEEVAVEVNILPAPEHQLLIDTAAIEVEKIDSYLDYSIRTTKSNVLKGTFKHLRKRLGEDYLDLQDILSDSLGLSSLVGNRSFGDVIALTVILEPSEYHQIPAYLKYKYPRVKRYSSL